MPTAGPRTGRDTRSTTRLGVLDEAELVVTGLTGMLRPHADRVRLAVLRSAATTDGLDVVLCDPFSPPGGATGTGSGTAGDARARVEEVAALGPARVLVYTWNTRASALHRALAGGAIGVVAKTSSTRELLAAVEAARRGQPVGPVPDDGPGVPTLSTRESEVLSLICRGLSNLEIAGELYVSVNSVKTYVRQTYRKIGVSRRTQAVAWAHRHGHPH